MNKLLTAIKTELRELVRQSNQQDVSVVLKTLNEAVHYNVSALPYIYEMFFMEALDLGQVPVNPELLSKLFRFSCTEDFLTLDAVHNPGTRSKVLTALRCPRTLALYQAFLVAQDPDSGHAVKIPLPTPVSKEEMLERLWDELAT